MIKGIDVSHHQRAMNWTKAREAGAEFAFIRAGSIDNVSGVCYTDWEFDRNSGAAPEVMPVGYYWYFRPNHPPIKQAEYFLRLVEDVDRKLPLVCDIEVIGSASVVKVFCDEIFSETGERVMIYTSPNAWKNYLVGDKGWAAKFPLWIAHWGVSEPIVPEPWEEFLVWQTHVGNDGYEYGADANRIDHDLGQPWLLEPVEPPPPVPVEGFALKVVQEGLRVRMGPGLNSDIIGVLREGDIIHPSNIGGSSAWVEFEFEGGPAWSNVQLGSDVNMVVIPPEGELDGGGN